MPDGVRDDSLPPCSASSAELRKRQEKSQPQGTEYCFPVHRGSGCTPRITGNRGELTTRNTVSRTSAVAGRTRLPWGRRERRPDGSAAGGHENFFQAPHRLSERPATCHPASPDARSREPSPCSDRSGNARAVSHSEGLQDRASGVRGGWVRCASGRHRRRLTMRMSMRLPSKNFSWPLTASAPSAQPDVPRPMSNPKRSRFSSVPSVPSG
jgi:hypothetical protein